MEQPGAMGGAPQGGGAAPQQQGQGAPGGQAGGDPAAQLQQLAQQYVQQGRPPEMATQIADALVQAMGLDAAPAGGGGAPGGDPMAGGGGDPMAGGGAPGMMARGGNMKQFTSRSKKPAEAAAPTEAKRPSVKMPTKK